MAPTARPPVACVIQPANTLQLHLLRSFSCHRQPKRGAAQSRRVVGTAAREAISPDVCKMDILKAAEGTCQGVRADVKTKGQVEDLVQRLEALNPTIDPAFSEGMDGRWIVKYSTAPPPSNGVLGPFVGLAYQEIDLQAGTYENILKVGGCDAWLCASLIANWEVLDGHRWRVHFQSLTISAWGLQLLQKQFQDTSRIWKFTYLDKDTRVMRAGQTGRDEDDVLFYMQRCEE